MRQPNDHSQFKRMAWKRVVDIIPSNFFQTRMLSYYKYPIPQRETLIRIIRDRCIERGVPVPQMRHVILIRCRSANRDEWGTSPFGIVAARRLSFTLIGRLAA